MWALKSAETQTALQQTQATLQKKALAEAAVGFLTAANQAQQMVSYLKANGGLEEDISKAHKVYAAFLKQAMDCTS